MKCSPDVLRDFFNKKVSSYRYFRGIHKHETTWLKKLQKMYGNFCILGTDEDTDCPIKYDNDEDKLIVNQDTFQIRCKNKKIGASIISIYGCDLSDIAKKDKKKRCRKLEAHANLILIDKHKKQLIRFEPQGPKYGKKMYNFHKLDKRLKELAKDMKLKYVSPIKFQTIGPQEMENDHVIKHNISTRHEGVGWCSTWSMMFLHFYLLTRNCLSLKQIASMITPHTEEEAYHMVRNYASNIVTTCKILN